MDAAVLDFLKDYAKVLVPLITFILGFLVSRFTMTAAEKKHHEQRIFETEKQLMEEGEARFQEFTSAMQQYINKARDNDVTLDDFFSISTTGERYFYHMKLTADAILSKKVSEVARDNTLIPKLQEAINRTLPKLYDTLSGIAERSGIQYNGALRRENYESLYEAVEKHGNTGNPIPQMRNA